MRKETTIFVSLFMILGSSFTPKFALAEDGIVETILISEEEPSSHMENRSMEKTDKHDDIATQFANVFSSIGASLISLFGG
ncbi:MAG: hypothetical protein ACREAE_01505 [Nitrosopumilaceae archaeon]